MLNFSLVIAQTAGINTTSKWETTSKTVIADSYPLSGGIESANWRRKHQFQIQKPWCDWGLLQSTRYFYLSSVGLESGPGVRSFLLLPGHRYWGSLVYTERQQSQWWRRARPNMSQLWSKAVAQRGVWMNWHHSPSGVNMPLLSPTAFHYLSRLLVIVFQAAAPLTKRSRLRCSWNSNALLIRVTS